MSLSRLLIDYNHNLFDEILLNDINLEVYSAVIEYLEDHPIIKRRKKEKRRNYIETEWGRLIWGADILSSSCLYDINTGRVVKS
jgi:predicted transcriptional regulator